MSTFSPELEQVLSSADPLAKRFEESGHTLFLVGGVVRDHLLGRVHDERDLDATTDARPEKIKVLVAELADAVWSQGERFGTIGCTIAGQPYEITTHRAESYDAGSRKPTVAFGDNIVDDLARRDFTVNAMAIDMANRVLVDPHGGRDDLEARVLRTPLDPRISFSEDPLRMLRAARFHAGHGLEPVPELVAAMSSMVDRVAIVSVERIRDELQKLLLLDTPGPGLRLLVETGLLPEVLPRLEGVAVADTDRLARRVSSMPADPAMRWAALLSDVTPTATDFRRMKFSGSMSESTAWFASHAVWGTEMGPVPITDPDLRRLAARSPKGRTLEDLVVFVSALRTSGSLDTADVDALAIRLAALRLREPDLDDPASVLDGLEVAKLLGIQPGPELGQAVDWLADLRIEVGPLESDEAGRRLGEWWANRGS